MAIAFPFIEVSIDDKGILREVQRAPGVLAVVGSTAGKGTAPANEPIVIDQLSDAVTQLNDVDGNGMPNPESPLYKGLKAVFIQNPRPSKVYAVKLGGNNSWDTAFKALEGADDVTFVTVAGATIKSGAGDPIAGIKALKAHCETQSAAGNKRIGVAAIDPGIPKTDDYVSKVGDLARPLKGSAPRMVVVAARGAVDDADAEAEVAAASASAIAGQPVASSIVLKKVGGFRMPIGGQFSPGEIKGLSQEEIIPIIDPSLVSGESLHFAEGTIYSTDGSQKYIDIVRLLDDVEFRLKAGLIGLIGDARITRAGLAQVIRQADGILGVVQASGGITRFEILIPTYNALLKPEAARSETEKKIINDARANRVVAMTVVIVIGPAIHRLNIALQPRF